MDTRRRQNAIMTYTFYQALNFAAALNNYMSSFTFTFTNPLTLRLLFVRSSFIHVGQKSIFAAFSTFDRAFSTRGEEGGGGGLVCPKLNLRFGRVFAT